MPPGHEGAVLESPQPRRPIALDWQVMSSAAPLGRSRLHFIRRVDPAAGLLVNVSPDRHWLGGGGLHPRYFSQGQRNRGNADICVW